MQEFEYSACISKFIVDSIHTRVAVHTAATFLDSSEQTLLTCWLILRLFNNGYLICMNYMASNIG